MNFNIYGWLNDSLSFGSIYMDYFVIISLGLILGSFTNVLIHRMPREKSVVSPPSACVSCGERIRWHDNIPVIGYLLLLGKCRKCKKKISLRYPIVEILVASLFVLTTMKFGWTPLIMIRDWPFMMAMIAIIYIDFDFKIIPDELSLGCLVLGLVTAWAVPDFGFVTALIGSGVGFFVFFLFAWGYYKLTKRAGLGGGDIKLLAAFGAYVGISGVFASIMISSILGSLVGIGWALVTGQKNVMSVAIPYGPFMVMGVLYYYFLGDILWPQFMTLT